MLGSSIQEWGNSSGGHRLSRGGPKAGVAGVSGVEASQAEATDRARRGAEPWSLVRADAWVRMMTVAYVALFVYACYQTRVLAPYSDLLDLLEFYFRSGERGDFVAYLLEPHGYVHRIPWLRLQVAADVELFGGSGLPFVIPAAMGLVAIACLLAKEAAATAPDGLSLPVASLVVMLALSSANAADVSTPASTSYTQTVVFAVLAILVAWPRGTLSRRGLVLTRGAALALAGAAAFGNAVGLMVWPALAFGAWRAGREERAWLGVVLLAGAAFGAAYVSGQSSPSAAEALTPPTLLRMLDYGLAYLGLPWVRASGPLGRAIGLVLLAAALVAVFRTGGAKAPRSERIGLCLVLFSLGTAAMAVLGRSSEAVLVDVPVRYTMLLLPLHAGLVILIGPWLHRLWQASPRASQSLAFAGLAVLLVQQVLIGQVAARAGQTTRAAITRFQAGERTPDMVGVIHPDLHHAARIRAEIVARGIYRTPGN